MGCACSVYFGSDHYVSGLNRSGHFGCESFQFMLEFRFRLVIDRVVRIFESRWFIPFGVSVRLWVRVTQFEFQLESVLPGLLADKLFCPNSLLPLSIQRSFLCIFLFTFFSFFFKIFYCLGPHIMMFYLCLDTI